MENRRGDAEEYGGDARTKTDPGAQSEGQPGSHVSEVSSVERPYRSTWIGSLMSQTLLLFRVAILRIFGPAPAGIAGLSRWICTADRLSVGSCQQVLTRNWLI